MSDSATLDHPSRRPVLPFRTSALGRIWSGIRDDATAADFLFLERWEINPSPGAAAALRVVQIRRANPELAAEIRAELRHGRPLTNMERETLLK
jgi:hypothetical protein